MNSKLVILSGLCLTTALITSVTVSKAQAGFQWNPPPRAAAPGLPSASPAQNSSGIVGGPLTPMPGDSAAVPIEPVYEVDMMDGGKPLPPVTTTNAQAGMKSINFQSPQNLVGGPPDVESDLLLPLPGQANNIAATSSATPPISPMSTVPDAPVVEGFGKDIPLAVALRQIVPPVYSLSFAPGLDQGKPVSWNGGKAWPDVVSSMLSSRKLHASLQGNTLNIAEGIGADLRLPVNDLPVIYDDSAKMASNDNPAVSSTGRPILNLAQQQRWEAKPGQGLRETLLIWSKAAHVELAWQDVPDMPIGNAFNYDGTFDQAVDSLLSLYGSGSTQPHGRLYPNLPEGPSVLVISSSN